MMIDALLYIYIHILHFCIYIDVYYIHIRRYIYIYIIWIQEGLIRNFKGWLKTCTGYVYGCFVRGGVRVRACVRVFWAGIRSNVWTCVRAHVQMCGRMCVQTRRGYWVHGTSACTYTCSCTMHDSFRGLSASEGALFIEGLVGCPSGTFKAQGHRHQGFSAFLDLHHLLVQPCHHGFQGSWRFASSFRLPEAKA